MKRAIFVVFLATLLKLGYGQSNFVGSGIDLQFDGNSDNYFDIGDIYNDLNFPVTFESWIYQTDYSLYTPLFATDSDTSGNYYGMYVRFDPSGKLIFEIGTGTGAGGAHRRGRITTTTAPLNQWIHVAIVANTITDITIYFNGVAQPTVVTDGTAGITSMVHNANHVNIGRYATVHRADSFIGYMDEIRLWNVSRTETEIREYMCKKLTSVDSTLIGYWIADDAYVSSILVDHSVYMYDGNLQGVVHRKTSAAPIGDESIYTYTTDYTFVTMQLNSAIGDKIKVNRILNDPLGVQIYRVDQNPFFDEGLNAYPEVYYGVFTVDSGTPTKYNVTYLYSYADGVITPDNESDAILSKRLDNSKTTWSEVPGSVLSTPTHKITKKKYTGRSEFLLNVLQPGGRFEYENQVVDDITNNSRPFVFPNPASTYVQLSGFNIEQPIVIYNITGSVVCEKWASGDSNHLVLDGLELMPGNYILLQNANGEIISAMMTIVNE